MIKYPLYKKNNSRNFTLVYPGLTIVSFDRIINLCCTTTLCVKKALLYIVHMCSWTQNLLIYYMITWNPSTTYVKYVLLQKQT